MTLAERLRAMELLWESISASPEKLASPAWHGEVLKRRLAKVKAGKGSFLTIQQLKARLAKERS
jgi:putative addiction module component (TIGR02574 family)